MDFRGGHKYVLCYTSTPTPLQPINPYLCTLGFMQTLRFCVAQMFGSVRISMVECVYFSRTSQCATIVTYIGRTNTLHGTSTIRCVCGCVCIVIFITFDQSIINTAILLIIQTFLFIYFLPILWCSVCNRHSITRLEEENHNRKCSHLIGNLWAMRMDLTIAYDCRN